MTISTDDFNRTNSSSLGANWTETTGNLEISSNKIQVVSGNEFGENKAKWTADCGSVDMYSQVAIHFNAGGGGYGNISIIVRANGSNGDHYRCEINQTTLDVKWIRISGGGYTSLYASAGNAISWSSGATHTWKVTADGTTNTNLKLYKDGVLQSGVNYTDSSSPLTTGERGGFGIDYVGGIADFYVDNFEQGKLVEATAATGRAVLGLTHQVTSAHVSPRTARAVAAMYGRATSTASLYAGVRSAVGSASIGLGASGTLVKVRVATGRSVLGAFPRFQGPIRVAPASARGVLGINTRGVGYQARALSARAILGMNTRGDYGKIVAPPVPVVISEPLVYRTPIPPDDLLVSYFGATATVVRYVDVYENDDETPFALGVKVLDANVSIDFDRDERRTFSLVLDNGLQEYDPQPNGIWYDKVFRLYKGFDTGTASWVRCQGHFLADSIKAPSFPPTCTINGRDFTKKLLQDKFGQATLFESGTEIAVVVKTIALNGGIVDFNLNDGGAFLTIDSLHEAGSSRWESIKKICDGYALEIFFDNNAVLTMRPYQDPVKSPIMFTFETGQRGNLVSYDKVVDDTRLKNHIVVIGANTANGLPAWGQAENNEPSSETRIQKVGRRTDTIDSPYVSTDNDAVVLAETYLMVAGLESYEVSLGAIQVPWLDVGNVIQFIDPLPWPNQPQQFMLTNVDLPWKLGAMTGQAKRVQLVGSGFALTKPKVNPRTNDPNYNGNNGEPPVDPPPDPPPPPPPPPPPNNANQITALFTAADAATWPAFSDGTIWRDQELTTGWAVNVPATAGRNTVVSNKGRNRSGPNGGPNGYASVLAYPDKTFPADFTAEFDFIPTWADRSVENYAAFTFRCTTRNLWDWRFLGSYELRFFRLSGAGVQLYKMGADTSETAIGPSWNTWAAGDTIHGKITCLGTNIKIRLWKNADTEPTTWTIDVNDSAFAGDTFCVGTGSGAPGTAESIVDWDNIKITTGGTVQPPPPSGAGALNSYVAYGTTGAGHKKYTINYKMTSITGTLVDATGVAIVPAGSPPVGGWRVATIGHGATGADDSAAPSLDTAGIEGNITGNIGTVANLCAAGFVVVMADYEGMGGTTGLRHPYMVGISAGRSLIDAAKCVAGLPGVTINNKVVAWGFSQGGHAALWAGELVASGQYGQGLNMVTVALDPVIPTQYVNQNWNSYFGLLNTYGQWVADQTLNLDLVVNGTAKTDMQDDDDFYGSGAMIADPTTISSWAAAFRKTDPGYQNGGYVLHFEATGGIHAQSSYVSRAPSYGTNLDWRSQSGGHDSTFTNACQSAALTWVNTRIPA